MFYINLNPIAPLRAKPEEQAEMTSQLLFGEIFTETANFGNWLYVNNQTDGYGGWIDRKTATAISEEKFEQFAAQTPIRIFKPTAECRVNGESIVLPAGSLIRNFSNESNAADILGNTYTFPPECLMKCGSKPPSDSLIADIARSFLNAPYLWGGKTIFGIDCSGLVQTAFGVCGINLPRDAAKQAEQGEIVSSLAKAQTADLAFFGVSTSLNDHNITHVGILLDNKTVIHSSGKVKIEKIDDNGIASHKLKFIKRCRE
ncbi:hydrolase Nlp/P60 [Bacteroidia bacterium]|nr:hydrolase Nlp/P60 [Bacteroidia bacterium]